MPKSTLRVLVPPYPYDMAAWETTMEQAEGKEVKLTLEGKEERERGREWKKGARELQLRKLEVESVRMLKM